MSVRTMARVWVESRQSGSHLLMLLAIADFADDDGNAYPAVNTLAEKCRMKPRNAQVILAALRQSGELDVRENEGPKGTNLYRVVLVHGVQSLAGVGVQRLAGVQTFAGVQGNARGGAKACAKGVQRIAPEPSLNHQEPPVKRARRAAAPSSGNEMPEVDEAVMRDWLQVRKAKRVGKVTPTVAKAFRAEADRAGLTLQRAVEYCCEAGWAAFKADWYEQREQAARRPAAVLHSDDIFRGAV